MITQCMRGTLQDSRNSVPRGLEFMVPRCVTKHTYLSLRNKGNLGLELESYRINIHDDRYISYLQNLRDQIVYASLQFSSTLHES